MSKPRGPAPEFPHTPPVGRLVSSLAKCFAETLATHSQAKQIQGRDPPALQFHNLFRHFDDVLKLAQPVIDDASHERWIAGFARARTYGFSLIPH